jgi:hypothetical protein
MQHLGNRIQSVLTRIRESERRFHRQPGSVMLLAVSKTRSPDTIAAAATAGLKRFGENYLQEALEKKQLLRHLDLEWHFIGPIQSNKSRRIAENFAWVHSVERLKIAERLNAQRPAEMPPLNICLQVNVSEEINKSGLRLAELPELVRALVKLPRLRLRGLMAIPAPYDDFTLQRRPFAQLREALEQLKQADLPENVSTFMDTLSMGMSHDLEAAVAEGATIVRIGTAIFGPREPKIDLGNTKIMGGVK